MAAPKPFWETKTLEQMSPTEWESLCDGCGKCCLLRLEDDEDGTIYTTRVTCQLLDTDSCRCAGYAQRFQKVPGCLQMTPELARTTTWLPDTCGYVRVARGQALADWHPLVSGTPDSVHSAGASVRGTVVSERDVDPDDIELFIVDEPAD